MNAHLDFTGHGQLFATDFDDVYYQGDGIEESLHVFIEGVQLRAFIQEKWDQHLHQDLPPEQFEFHIAETGFGTGLNFTLALGVWRDLDIQGKLHFTSVEKFPLSSTQMLEIYHQRNELGLKHQDWVDSYSNNDLLADSLTLSGQDYKLNLLLQEGAEGFKTWAQHHPHSIDAWFLDGFDPSKNPQMWSALLFEQIALLSHAQTRVATFTSAGLVKRGLMRVGFNCTKRDGILGKQHILRAAISDEGAFSPEDWQDYLQKALWGSLQKGSHLEALQLIAEGARFNSWDQVYLACTKGIFHLLHKQFAQTILSGVEYQDPKRGDSLLHGATRSQSLDEVHFFTQQFSPSELNLFLDAHGRTALFLAAYLKSKDLLTALNQAGLSKDFRDKYGKTIDQYHHDGTEIHQHLGSLS